MTGGSVRRASALASIVLACFAQGCARDDHAGGEGEHAPGAAAYERGPHRGRWLADGEFAVELTIFEEGVPPEFRAFVYRGKEQVDPTGVALDVTLRRLGDRVDRIAFAPRGEYLLGDQTVYEPHSFDAEVVAREDGREHRFSFSSYENRVTIAADQRETAGIAEAATIRERVVLNGRIAANEDSLAHVMPRFPGVVRSVSKRLGDAVARGDLLATIESNESLRPFDLRAHVSGTVIAKDVTVGEFVSTDRELFRIADLTEVWVDLGVYRRDFARLAIGQSIRVDARDGTEPVETSLSYLSPIGSATTQTLLARAVLPNPDRSWRPGLFVAAEVEVDAATVPVAVPADAIQRIRDWDVVFITAGDVFEAQPIELGRRDAERVEVVSGLAAGQLYVTTGSFILKAEAGKSGATHDH